MQSLKTGGDNIRWQVFDGDVKSPRIMTGPFFYSNRNAEREMQTPTGWTMGRQRWTNPRHARGNKAQQQYIEAHPHEGVPEVSQTNSRGCVKIKRTLPKEDVSKRPFYWNHPRYSYLWRGWLEPYRTSVSSNDTAPSFAFSGCSSCRLKVLLWLNPVLTHLHLQY